MPNIRTRRSEQALYAQIKQFNQGLHSVPRFGKNICELYAKSKYMW